ncbi:hypothetical protein [Hymenobacter tenuis]
MKIRCGLVMLGLGWLSAGQGLAQVKVSEVEIWGLPTGTTTADFVAKLNQNKQTVCMATIKPMGFPDATVIGLDNIMLVTLRSQPARPCTSPNPVTPITLAQLNAAWPLRELHTMEFQAAFRALPATVAHDTAAVNGIRRKSSRLRDADFQAALAHLQRPEGLAFAEALAVLCSAAPDSVREKATAQLAARLQTPDQARQLLPYLRDSEVGGRLLQLVRGFYRYQPPSAAGWAPLMPEIVKGLNSPDPIVVSGLAMWLVEQHVPRTYTRQLLTNGATTQLEILHGKHPDLVVFKQQLYPLLSHLSSTEIRDEQAALAYLGKFQKR